MAEDKQVTPIRSILVTGAAGYIGRLVTEALVAERGLDSRIVALDVREVEASERLQGVIHVAMDICSSELADLLAEHRIETVVHLAAIVNPPKKGGRELAYRVDVEGTKNVLESCLKAGVEKLIVTSSGAAYGYHPANSAWLTEEDPIRGNREFAYAYHKRLVEQMLAQYRREHPELRQLIFRPGTVLGEGTRNQITDIFDAPVVVGLYGVDTPFVFIWDKDVVDAILEGARTDKTGIYNLAGDGVVPLREVAKEMGKPFIGLPVGLVKGSLAVGHRLGLTRYGPEQVAFLQYRPVLSNRRLKEEFGYTPKKSSRQVLELFRESRVGGSR